MSDETIRTLITCLFSLGGILISNIFTYAITNTANKHNKKSSLNEERYNNVFSPIHRILFFSNEDFQTQSNRIHMIIINNYSLTTDILRKEFKNCVQKGYFTTDFYEIITDSCTCLEMELGYANSKLNKRQKEVLKDFIFTKKHFWWRMFLLSFIALDSIFAIAFFCYFYYLKI